MRWASTTRLMMYTWLSAPCHATFARTSMLPSQSISTRQSPQGQERKPQKHLRHGWEECVDNKGLLQKTWCHQSSQMAGLALPNCSRSAFLPSACRKTGRVSYTTGFQTTGTFSRTHITTIPRTVGGHCQRRVLGQTCRIHIG